jgi:hypothetical protein
MPLTTLIPDQCPCGACGLPPETLYFRRLAPGATTTVTWDARALAMYNSYEDCRPSGQYCSARSHGAARPVGAGDYDVEFAVVETLPTGPGTNCLPLAGGDVSCTVAAQMQTGGQCDPVNIGVHASFVRQSFSISSAGDSTVLVTLQ